MPGCNILYAITCLVPLFLFVNHTINLLIQKHLEYHRHLAFFRVEAIYELLWLIMKLGKGVIRQCIGKNNHNNVQRKTPTCRVHSFDLED